MMDYTTLCRLRNAITPASWKEINRLLVEAAVGRGVIDGERLRLDTTVVETNIHYPTDSSLFWDVYRVLGRLMGRAREFDESLVGPKRVHHRRAKRLYLKISRRGEPIEFGHMIQIQQVGAKVITGYAAFEKKPREHELVEQALEHHRDLFGKYPECLAADRGYYRSIEAIERLKRKVAMVSIAKKGKRTEEEAGREHDPFFRLGQRFRAGIEGTVSFLKRVFRLSRALAKGWEHFAATIGATIFAHNLLILSRL
jgi:IS5 family transposase